MGSMKFKGFCCMVKLTTCFLALTVIASTFPTLAHSEEYKVWEYIKLPGVPEGVCVDSKNNLYASITFSGEVVLINGDGTYEHIAWVPSIKEVGQGNILGMDVDA